MAHPLSFLTGASLGAVAMYYLDPDVGRRRRSLAVGQYVHCCKQATKAADVLRRDASNRLYGVYAETRSSWGSDNPTDDVLNARVRSKLGRYVSNPASIHVDVANGRITLFGSVRSHEREILHQAIRSVRGVKDVHMALRVDDALPIAARQNRQVARGELGSLMQENWSPTTRAAVSAAGFGLLATCLASRSTSSMLLGAIGMALSTRAVSNQRLQRLVGAGSGRRGIDIQTGVAIDAPIDKVFDLLSNPENYSRLTDVISSVRNLGNNRFQKMVRLPGGMEVMLDEQLVTVQKNKCVHWRSEEESVVPYAGSAWFTETENGRTAVQVCMTYNPPGGVLAEAAATLAQMNPKKLMDDFLMRAKNYLETGRQPRDVLEKQPPTVEVAKKEAGTTGARSPEPEHPQQQKDSSRVERASSPMQAGEAAIHDL